MNLKPSTRRYLYRVSIAVLALAAFYGIVAQDAVPVITGLITAVLAIADVNVSDG